MASPSSIPRFLLPQSGLIWRRANLGNQLRASPELLTVRHASNHTAKPAGKKGKVMILEKPERFNPPSHGARLPRKTNRPEQQHYGGALSGEEVAAQRTKEYPGLPAPQGTWAHWFWNSKALHLTITMVGCFPCRPRIQEMLHWLTTASPNIGHTSQPGPLHVRRELQGQLTLRRHAPQRVRLLAAPDRVAAHHP